MHRQSPIIRWRKYSESYTLTGNKCISCNAVYYPKKELCTCGSAQFQNHQFSGKGKLSSYTEIKSAPEEFSFMIPYCIGIIQLDEGPKIIAQIADATGEELQIGMEVETVFRKNYKVNDHGIIHYTLKCIPCKHDVM